jgi:hypothetical protein
MYLFEGVFVGMMLDHIALHSFVVVWVFCVIYAARVDVGVVLSYA